MGLSLDPEGIALGRNGHLYISDEYGPSVYEFTAAGKFVRAFEAPANLLPKLANGSLYFAADDTPETKAGRQSNRGYEGLTITPDGKKLLAVLQVGG